MALQTTVRKLRLDAAATDPGDATVKMGVSLGPATDGRAKGQVSTPASIASFMAGLLPTTSDHLRILDPGAGTGVLSVAVCERILNLRSPRRAEFVLCETDSKLLPELHETMRRCCSDLRAAGHEMSYDIRQGDFVLGGHSSGDQRALFDDTSLPELFDAAIMNPPYFKLRKQSAHSRAFEHIVHGQPNIYALFMARAAMMLRAGGHLVAITPRSFCNGLYFRDFRRWLLARLVLRRIHLFESRTDAFKGSEVLQESVITLWEKAPQDRAAVTVSTSHGADLIGADALSNYAVDRIIRDHGSDQVIRIPCNSADAEIMDAVEAWPSTFLDRGLRISTGPVVPFRAARYLLDNADEPNAVPLLFPHNVRPYETRWPVRKAGKPVALRACVGSERLLLDSRNYVLLRRFSAKEEQRRLTASSFLPDSGSWPARIAIENHLNYVYLAKRSLTEAETVGLTAIFNSVLVDRYFRTLSGNTQVNATEIRAMPFPSLEVIAQIGAVLRNLDFHDRTQIERIVLVMLGLCDRMVRELSGSSE